MPAGGRPGSRARPAVAFAALWLAACNTPAGPPGDDTGDATMTAGDTEALPDPAFLNPALGEFTVDSSQHVPKDITVRNVIPGNTQLMVDGRTVGTLAAGATFGELTEDRLRIFLHGALALGTHTLQLVTTGGSGPQFSVTLTMNIAPPSRALPLFRATLSDAALGPADALIESGTGADAVLGVVARTPDPALRLYLAEGTTWSTTPVAEVPLAGYVLDPAAFAPAVSARALPGLDTIRIAHSRGLPGAAIVTRDLALAPAPALGPEETALDLTDDVFVGAEFSAVGRPILAGDALVAEFIAADDAEVPHPGDRGLAHIRRNRTGAGWAVPQRVTTPAPTDLDAAGRALDLTDPAAPALSVRVGQRLAGLLTFSDAGAALVSLAPDELDLVSGDPAVLTTLASDLGGRTVATVARDRLGLTFLGTTGLPSSRADTPAPGSLPATQISAPAAAAVVLGYSTFLIPFGDAAPVHVVLGDGTRANATPLTDPAPVHCDAVVLLAGLAGNDDAAPALPFACMSGGAVRLGVLTAEQP